MVTMTTTRPSVARAAWRVQPGAPNVELLAGKALGLDGGLWSADVEQRSYLTPSNPVMARYW